MGKRFLIYLDSEIAEEFEFEENKSKTVSGLLKKHYHEGISHIEARIVEQEAELKRTRKKLKNKLREAKAERIAEVRQGLGGEKSATGGLRQFLKEYPVK